MKKTVNKATFIILAFLLPQFVLAEKNPRNVILLIGDGMGLGQMYAAMIANGNKLNIEHCTHFGFSKTSSADRLAPDSGAGGTAIACGVKTLNGMIGLSADSLPVNSILELSAKNHLSTGIVTTSSLTHTTPACFVSHQTSHNMYEEIAADYLKSGIDVMIGGGRKYFLDRTDGRNLANELKTMNYQLAYSLEDMKKIHSGKLAGLLYDDQNPPMPEREDMLAVATEHAIDLLSDNKKGFFLLIEGSQIDWAAHDNNAEQTISEVIDFDRAVGKAIDFAKADGNTLVVITGDHETGGMAILDGKPGSNELKAGFASKDHTGLPVPVYAFGPGAANFSGFHENTVFKAILSKLLKLKGK